MIGRVTEVCSMFSLHLTQTNSGMASWTCSRAKAMAGIIAYAGLQVFCRGSCTVKLCLRISMSKTHG